MKNNKLKSLSLIKNETKEMSNKLNINSKVKCKKQISFQKCNKEQITKFKNQLKDKVTEGKSNKVKNKLKAKKTMNDNVENNQDSDEEKPPIEVDPFFLHFINNLSKDKASEIEDFSNWKTSFIEWPILKRIIVEVPVLKSEERNPKFKKRLLEEKDSDPPTIGNIPAPLTENSTQSCFFLQKKLADQFNSETLSPLQSELLRILSHYVDFHYPYSTHEKWDEIRAVYVLHCINHVLKTKKQIQQNTKLNVVKKLKTEKNEDIYLDKGFTHPKVLILLPFKHSAYKVINKMISTLNVEVTNKNRFESDFGPPDGDKASFRMPDDFNKVFEGDIKEDFKIGLKITKKTLKLYANFTVSDIIIGSPLGIRYILDTDENNEKNNFLSSIEILVMDQADIFLMQNWEHILVIRDFLNKMPKALQDTIQDLYRIRRWCLDGLSSLYRQTIIFSSIINDFNRAFFKKTTNFAGKMEVLNLSTRGSLSDITVAAEVIFQRVQVPTKETAYSPDAQFAHFTQVILPLLRRKNQTGTLIFVSDYCDYVLLVNYFKEDRGTNVSTLNEYMINKASQIAKSRHLFFIEKRLFIIYTERLHFYKRCKIKGVKNVVFYGLPTYPHFFSEICNLMVDELQNPRSTPMLEPHSVLVPFQIFDATKLVGIVGSARAEAICTSDETIHKCETGT